jgi:post-segregation antitoxin (ccd killing protein)
MAVKVSVTIDDEILAEARGLAPDGNLSALVNDALSERVRRERLRTLLAEETATAGPMPAELTNHVTTQWPFSSSTPES